MDQREKACCSRRGERGGSGKIWQDGLNIGCGDLPAAGWVNIDIHRSGPRPSLIADARALPFRDGAFGRVYAGHVLEHLDREDAAEAVREMRRVGRGPMMIVGPDPEHPEAPAPTACGAHRWPGDEHRWVPTTEEMVAAVLDVLPEMDVRVHLWDEEPPEGWPIPARVSWQYVIQLCRHLSPG